MYGLVAVEKNLSNVISLLEAEGYEVVPLDESDLDGVDAIVVSGADINLMNIQETLSEVPVIDASGKTAAEVLDEIEKL